MSDSLPQVIVSRQDQPTRTTKGERDGSRRVTGRVKAAADLMVWEGLEWQAAAGKVGLHVRSMRYALNRPHFRAYLQEQRQVFRAAASTANISRLVSLRDQDDNKIAALQAVRILEDMGGDGASGDAPIRTPGIAIQIVNVSPAALPDGLPDR